MSEERDQLQREECRWAVRDHLHKRSTVAQDAATIARMLRIRGLHFEKLEVESACAFFVTDEQFIEHRSPVGATRHYQITGKGSREHERSIV
jgi:hypothetical protein